MISGSCKERLLILALAKDFGATLTIPWLKTRWIRVVEHGLTNPDAWGKSAFSGKTMGREIPNQKKVQLPTAERCLERPNATEILKNIGLEPLLIALKYTAMHGH